MSKERSLLILKPDAIECGLVAEIKDFLSRGNLVVARIGVIVLNMELVQDLYQWPVVHHHEALKNYLCGVPLSVWIIEGEEAVAKCLGLKKNLRERYCHDRLHTLIHCPDTDIDFKREFKILFPGQAE